MVFKIVFEMDFIFPVNFKSRVLGVDYLKPLWKLCRKMMHKCMIAIGILASRLDIYLKQAKKISQIFRQKTLGSRSTFRFQKRICSNYQKIFLYINRVLDRFFKIEIVIVFSLEKIFRPGSRSRSQFPDRICFLTRKNFLGVSLSISHEKSEVNI